MTPFTIEQNAFLNRNIQGFYHSEFGGYDYPGNPNFLYKLKNDPHHNWSEYKLEEAQRNLQNVLLRELPMVLQQVNLPQLTVCVVPRAKANNNYRPNQLLFNTTVRNTIHLLGNNFIDGTDYIIRHKNTKTTHLRKPIEGFTNDGENPYRGISRDTCHFSNNIRNKNIL